MKAEDKIEWFLIALVLICALGCLAVRGQSTNPVTVTMLNPTNGQVVSGILPISVVASSSAAPIKRINFSRDGSLIASVYYSQPPQHVRLIVK